MLRFLYLSWNLSLALASASLHAANTPLTDLWADLKRLQEDVQDPALAEDLSTSQQERGSDLERERERRQMEDGVSTECSKAGHLGAYKAEVDPAADGETEVCIWKPTKDPAAQLHIMRSPASKLRGANPATLGITSCDCDPKFSILWTRSGFACKLSTEGAPCMLHDGTAWTGKLALCLRMPGQDCTQEAKKLYGMQLLGNQQQRKHIEAPPILGLDKSINGYENRLTKMQHELKFSELRRLHIQKEVAKLRQLHPHMFIAPVSSPGASWREFILAADMTPPLPVHPAGLAADLEGANEQLDVPESELLEFQQQQQQQGKKKKVENAEDEGEFAFVALSKAIKEMADDWLASKSECDTVHVLTSTGAANLRRLEGNHGRQSLMEGFDPSTCTILMYPWTQDTMRIPSGLVPDKKHLDGIMEKSRITEGTALEATLRGDQGKYPRTALESPQTHEGLCSWHMGHKNKTTTNIANWHCLRASTFALKEVMKFLTTETKWKNSPPNIVLHLAQDAERAPLEVVEGDDPKDGPKSIIYDPKKCEVRMDLASEDFLTKQDMGEIVKKHCRNTDRLWSTMRIMVYGSYSSCLFAEPRPKKFDNWEKLSVNSLHQPVKLLDYVRDDWCSQWPGFPLTMNHMEVYDQERYAMSQPRRPLVIAATLPFASNMALRLTNASRKVENKVGSDGTMAWLPDTKKANKRLNYLNHELDDYLMDELTPAKPGFHYMLEMQHKLLNQATADLEKAKCKKQVRLMVAGLEAVPDQYSLCMATDSSPNGPEMTSDTYPAKAILYSPISPVLLGGFMRGDRVVNVFSELNAPSSMEAIVDGSLLTPLDGNMYMHQFNRGAKPKPFNESRVDHLAKIYEDAKFPWEKDDEHSPYFSQNREAEKKLE